MVGKSKGFKRGWTHTKTRGRETVIACSFCGRKVPKYKTFIVYRGFRINDPMLRKQLGKKANLTSVKMYACPSCARFHRIVEKRRKR